MDNNNKYKNTIGKISAILFICIVIIISLTFIGCMIESEGETSEATAGGAVWWIFGIVILITGIPFLLSRGTCYRSSYRVFKKEKIGYRNE